ncbi:MAG: DUF2059 domain-containing protein [Acidobacteriota bacterium]|nr:DUF2059 domain-containing protein [Acidobacteriota bacterium]
MKRLALLLALLLCLPSVSRADEASKRAKAKELFAVLHLDKLTAQLMDQVMKQASSFSNQVDGGKMTPEMQTKFASFQKQVFDLLNAQIGWNAMEPQYEQVYAQTYTEEEMDAMLAFYKSPLGSSIVAKMPEATAKTNQVVQAKMVTIPPEVVQLMQDFARDNASSAAGPAPSAK